MWERKLNDTADLKLKEGANTKAIETAKNMLKNNLDIEMVHKCTGLSLQEIEAITL